MSRPIILSTWSFGQRANAAAWDGLQRGGSSIDAVEAACKDAELDLDNPTVGQGAYPDASGDISLDASFMISPDKAGSVCFVRHYLHAITLARQVMLRTPHVLLAGTGAEAFAHEVGMTPQELRTEFSRKSYDEWKSHRQYAPAANIEERNHDTIGVLSIDQSGLLAGGCTTSGMAFKRVGRVGDSPIVGHGLYVDPRAGAVVCTGHGERVMGICGAFLGVEKMRDGLSPVDAGIVVLERMINSYPITNEDQVGVILLRPDGQWTSVALRAGFKTAVRTNDRDELVEPEFTYFK